MSASPLNITGRTSNQRRARSSKATYVTLLRQLGTKKRHAGADLHQSPEQGPGPGRSSIALSTWWTTPSGSPWAPTSRAISTKTCWSETPRTPSRAPGSISRRAPSSVPWSSVCGPNRASLIADPACGTGGFFLTAYDFITDPDNFKLRQEAEGVSEARRVSRQRDRRQHAPPVPDEHVPAQHR